ncbi:MAG: hypothetical protein HY690_04840 [Chloroflexi bacterium]|nr:hypothetical protein [Chloroflexota bacterium]
MKTALVRMLVLSLALGLVLPLAAVPETAGTQPSFSVADPVFWQYVQQRGGLSTFGEPISRPFVLHGRTSQLFQRALLQIGPDGHAQLANLLDDGLAGLQRVGGLTLPAPDPALQAATPAPGSPDYAEQMVAFLRQEVPDSFQGQPVNFLQTFLRSVQPEGAWLEGGENPDLSLLLGLEVWGAPTSRPTPDPNNPTFIYQRFQRGIMHYQQDKGATEGLLVGELFKQVLTGQGLSPDLAAAMAGSRYARQYDPATARGPVRPGELPASRLDGAFLPGPAGDARFGVVAIGSLPSRDGLGMDTALQTLGASAWYSFDGRTDQAVGRVELVRPGVDFEALARRARARPGAAWIVGNEPNVPGQDDLDPAAYADFLARVASTVRGADSTARLVGPNVLNWDVTCTLCPGFSSGRTWSEVFADTYRARYGPLPLDAWGMHTYSLDWRRLPLVDAATDQAQLAGARAWLDAQGLDLPLWLTEFGVVWGYEGIEWVERPGGGYVAEPRGQFRADLLARYLDEMFGWLTQNSAPARIERWFLYGTMPLAEPFATTPAGIALFQPDSFVLTPLGERFRAWTGGQ